MDLGPLAEQRVRLVEVQNRAALLGGVEVLLRAAAAPGSPFLAGRTSRRKGPA